MAGITIEAEYCKACGLCITTCKKGVIRYGKGINAMGYHAAEVDGTKGCIGCRLCAVVCPEAAIEVYR
ncbi:MAG: 4Fe-4S binding protein [Angelakisella sp.]|nr:4Fe-4S binding protein [Angelakisella sp.]